MKNKKGFKYSNIKEKSWLFNKWLWGLCVKGQYECYLFEKKSDSMDAGMIFIKANPNGKFNNIDFALASESTSGMVVFSGDSNEFKNHKIGVGKIGIGTHINDEGVFTTTNISLTDDIEVDLDARCEGVES